MLICKVATFKSTMNDIMINFFVFCISVYYPNALMQYIVIHSFYLSNVSSFPENLTLGVASAILDQISYRKANL